MLQYEEHQACSDHVSSRNESNIAMTTQINSNVLELSLGALSSFLCTRIHWAMVMHQQA